MINLNYDDLSYPNVFLIFRVNGVYYKKIRSTMIYIV